jgi:hypothetical protein
MIATKRFAAAALGLALLACLPLAAAADTAPGEPVDPRAVEAETGAAQAEAAAEAAEAAPMLDEPVPSQAPPVPVDPALATEPEVFTGVLAREDWSDRRAWRYGTQHLFPLTRGMEDAGIPPWGRWPLYVFTVPFDVAHAPLGALAGLYGD